MSERELQRRQLTGTLSSSTATARVAAIGLGDEKFIHASDPAIKCSLELIQTKFRVETSSKYYKAPTYMTIPASNESLAGNISKTVVIAIGLRSFQHTLWTSKCNFYLNSWEAWVTHHCDPGSIQGLGVICELSLLLILHLASRVFLRVLQ
jgi:hypothetical protein